jgi:GNAT superfamily N-acetyltransferase
MKKIIKNFTYYLKHVKYINCIQELTIELCNDDQGKYINLNVIRIKKSKMNTGIGTAVMSDIIRFADNHNVRIKLWVTNLWGADIKRLYKFYERFGFVLIKNDNDGHMIYYPNNNIKII